MHILGGREITADYNKIWFHEGVDTRIAKMEMWMAKNIGEALVAEYPNRQWGIDVDVRGGVIVITAPGVSLSHGYHMHIREDNITQLITRAKTAAGEILERYGLARSKIFNPEKLEVMERGVDGDVLITQDSMVGEDPLKR